MAAAKDFLAETTKLFRKEWSMAVYLILFLLAAGMGIPLCGICEKKEGRGVLWYCIVMGAVLTVISSLRFGVG